MNTTNAEIDEFAAQLDALAIRLRGPGRKDTVVTIERAATMLRALRAGGEIMSDTMMRSLRQGFGSAAGRAEQVDAYQKLCHQAADRISRLEAEVARKDGALQELLDATDEPPEANCSCHMSPPCSDCIDFGHIREAIATARAALKPTKEG